MKFLFIILSIIIFLIITFAFIGYYRTKVEFNKFMKEKLSNLPIITENVTDVVTKQLKDEIKYLITSSSSNNIIMNYLVSQSDLLIKTYNYQIDPFVKFKYLEKDLVFPGDRDLVFLHGTYEMELHISETDFGGISKKRPDFS